MKINLLNFTKFALAINIIQFKVYASIRVIGEVVKSLLAMELPKRTVCSIDGGYNRLIGTIGKIDGYVYKHNGCTITTAIPCQSRNQHWKTSLPTDSMYLGIFNSSQF